VPASRTANGYISHKCFKQSENFREHVFCCIFKPELLLPLANRRWWGHRVNSFTASDKFINFAFRYHEDPKRQPEGPYEKYTTLQEGRGEDYKALLEKYPLIFGLDLGHRDVYGISSSLSLRFMERPALQRSCTLVASHNKVKYFPYKMGGYGHFRALVSRVTGEITKTIYPQHRGDPAASYRTLNLVKRDEYRDLRSKEIALQREKLFDLPCSDPQLKLPDAIAKHARIG
jgi:hypothetical protein